MKYFIFCKIRIKDYFCTEKHNKHGNFFIDNIIHYYRILPSGQTPKNTYPYLDSQKDERF